MKKVLLKLLIVAFVLGSQIELKASHYMGSEITWECLPSGQFQFTLKYYRDCNGISYPYTLALKSNSPDSTILMSLVSGWPKEIKDECNPDTNFTHISCSDAPFNMMTVVEEWVYKSAPVTINGVPPASGWEFYDGTCCRNPSTNILGQPSWQARAKMYPYNNQNTFPCYDSSPQFAVSPIIIYDAGYPVTLNNSMFDVELDSLVFEWGRPLMSGGVTLTYTAGYSWQNPLPDTLQNPNNVSATLNPKNGDISLTSYTIGSFVTSVKVTAYKCGVKVSENWREIQNIFKNDTSLNTAPVVIPPFNNATSFSTVAHPGDLITFNISASDLQYLPLTPPVPQTVKVEAYGLQFGDFISSSGSNPSTMSTTTGCLNPPCAALTPAPEPGVPFSNHFGVATTFSWQTSCNHITNNLACNAKTNSYKFVIKVSDDYCPFPAENIYEINIDLIPDSLTVYGPKISCIKVLNDTSIQLIWNKTNYNGGAAPEYRVFSADSGGVYSLIGKNTNLNDTSIIVNNDNKFKPMNYNVVLYSSCASNQAVGDTLSSIFLKAKEITYNKTMLNWNAPLSTLPANYTDYYIYKSTSANNWSLIATTSSTSFMDTLSHNIDSVRYRVEISNSVCTSISNEAKILPSGIEESDLSEKIKIYPNPANEFLKLEWEADLQIDLVEIYNTSSQLILKKEIRSSDRNALIELKDISKGVYIVILKGDGINHIDKVILK